MAHEKPDTHTKALQVNLDPVKYGTFAEIGAGQEVARWFLRVGGAGLLGYRATRDTSQAA